MALESNLFFRDLDEFMRFLLEVFSFLEIVCSVGGG